MATTKEGPEAPERLEEDHGFASIDKVVFGTGLALVLAFGAWGVIKPKTLGDIAAKGMEIVTQSFGWLFIIAGAAFCALCFVLAFTRYGRIRLGKDDERPEFSTPSWFAMMFAAGMGIGLVFYGAAEPLSHFATPPLGMAEPNTEESASLGLQYTIFHWGLHPWALYAVVGLALAYTTFRKGNPNLLSSIVLPHQPVEAPARRAIDIFAVFITVFGAATSLGLGALQINSGLNSAYNVPQNNTMAIVVIVCLAFIFGISAVSGVGKGIKIISNINMGLAGLLAVFVLVLGPTLYIVNTWVEMIGNYTTNFFPMSFRTGIYGDTEWMAGWTLFYWAWWMSWAPFVGTFIARISRGRTIRQFIVCVLLVPTLVSSVWFAILGGASLRLEMGGAGLNKVLAGEDGQAKVLFSMLDNFPLSAVSATIVVLLITFFFVSSADSASVVLGMFSSKGHLEPSKYVVMLWGTMIAVTAIALLLAGGLPAVQSAAIVIGLPFLFVLVAVCVQLVRQLRKEPVVSTVPEGVYTVMYEEMGATREQVDAKLAEQQSHASPEGNGARTTTETKDASVS